jgi:transcriptional regulator
VVNPSAVNRRKYARAQEYIRLGMWIVDPEAGVIYSRRTRKPLRGHVSQRGYIVYGVTFPGGSRGTAKTVPVLAARVIWESVHGPIPDSLEVNHKDGNKSNNSISNFELATSSGNKLHAFRTGLRKPTAGERVGVARLTEVQVREIQTLLTRGVSQAAISRQYGVSQGTISWINRGKSWKYATSAEGFQPSQTEGPLRGELNGSARLTERDVVEIHQRLSQGVYQRVIADRFSVSQQTISAIRSRKVWSHINPGVDGEQLPGTDSGAEV